MCLYKPPALLKDDFSPVRLQTALLIAEDTGDELTYEYWVEAIVTSGLLGNWRQEFTSKVDPIDCLYMIINMTHPEISKVLKGTRKLAECIFFQGDWNV